MVYSEEYLSKDKTKILERIGRKGKGRCFTFSPETAIPWETSGAMGQTKEGGVGKKNKISRSLSF